MPKRQRASIENRGNKLWHGSRFILPEHRTTMFEVDRREKLIDRPTLSEDKLEEINRILSEVLQHGKLVTLSVYKQTGIERVNIVPKRFEPATRTLKGWCPLVEGMRNIPLEDIIGAVMCE